MKKIIISIIFSISLFACIIGCVQNVREETETIYCEVSDDTESKSVVQIDIEVSKNEGGRYGGGRGNSSAPAL